MSQRRRRAVLLLRAGMATDTGRREESFDRLVRDWKMTSRIIKQRRMSLATSPDPALSNDLERVRPLPFRLVWN